MDLKFTSNQTVVTCGINAKMQEDLNFMEHVHACTLRHFMGDWGNMDEEDKEENEKGLASGKQRLMSSYEEPGHPKVWVITEWDRSVTTVLFPSEY